MRTLIPAGVALALLSACTTPGGSGDVITALPADLMANARVEVVEVTVPDGSSTELAPVLQTRIASKMRACATGARPLTLQVRITQFDRADPLQTYAGGASNNIRGTARLLDPATGRVVGDYDINRSSSGGGFMAAAILAESQIQMGDAFGDELCLRAFNRPPR